MVVDLDHFKEVKTALGHQAGDGAAGRRGRPPARRSCGPTTSWRAWAATSSAVLLASPSGAGRVVEQVVLAVADLAVAYDVGVGASVGTACWPADGDTYAELVHTADVRMYAAKRDGRERAQGDLGSRCRAPARPPAPSLVG